MAAKERGQTKWMRKEMVMLHLQINGTLVLSLELVSSNFGLLVVLLIWSVWPSLGKETLNIPNFPGTIDRVSWEHSLPIILSLDSLHSSSLNLQTFAT